MDRTFLCLIGGNMKERFSKYLGLILILILGGFLILYNIDDTLLWKDEAGTAQIGINTLKYGIPKVWDGKNMMSSSDGNSFNDSFVVTSHGWLQYYIAGISIAVLGENTLAARLPFAMASIASIILMWFLSKKVFKKDSYANLTTLIYVLYIPFILYSRQARYYSLSFFFLSASSLLLIELISNEKKKRLKLKSILLSCSVTLMAFSNHLSAAIWCLSALVYIVLIKKQFFLKTFLPVIIGGILWMPWYVYTIATSHASYGKITFDSHILTKLLITFWKTNTYFIPIISMVFIASIFGVIYFVKKTNSSDYKENKELSPCCFFILLIVFNIVVVSIPNWSVTNHYLLCVVIAAPILMMYFFNYIRGISSHLGVILLLTMLFSNMLNVVPYYCLDTTWIPETKTTVNNLLSANDETTNYGIIASPATDGDAYIVPIKEYLNSLRILFYPKEYANELLHHIELPNELIIDVLKENALDGETVLMMGIEYEPIVYYTNLRVVNTLSEKVKPWTNQFSDYPNLKKFSYLTHVDDDNIDWIIVKKDGYNLNVLLDNPNFLNENKDEFEVFECITADIPLSNSPDLDYHIFSTVSEKDTFYMFHKINKGES